MPKITFIDHHGTARDVEVPKGHSVMEGAIRNDVPGIDADCGGACACATCLVVVTDTWRDRLAPPSEMEAAMIEFAERDEPGGRLSCQIVVDDSIDGLVVCTPERQHL